MERKYAIFYSRDRKTMKLNLAEPFGIVELVDDEVKLTGPRDFLNRWKPYFTHNPAWLKYMTEKDPFAVMASKTSMGQMIPARPTDSEDHYETAAAGLKGEIVTEIVKPTRRPNPQN